MRVIENAQALTSTITRPIMLVELGFDPTIYLSTAQEIQWNGVTWIPNGVSVGEVSFDDLGGARIAIRVSNLDRTFGIVALSQSVNDRRAAVWIYYPDGPIEPLELTTGVMSGCSIGEHVDINIISQTENYGQTPRFLCAPPLFNHLPPDGTILRWGNSSITLERR